MSLDLQNFTRSIKRKSDLVLWSMQDAARHGLPGVLVSPGNVGLGDVLLCTALFREWRKRGKQNLWIMTPYPELFANNTDIDRIVPDNNRYRRIAAKMWRCVVPGYATYRQETDSDLPPAHPIIAEMCRRAEISGTVNLRPYLWLTDTEKRTWQNTKRPIVIHSSGRAAQFYMQNKEWYPERFQQVVNAFATEYRVIQIGSRQDPRLEGTLDLRGKTSMRETAALLHHAQLFVGQVGFAMHLARAVDCRSVIIYGGRELPQQSGYIANENLERRPACSPCWTRNSCDYDRVCMSMIPVDEVIAASKRQIEHVGESLPVEQYSIETQ